MTGTLYRGSWTDIELLDAVVVPENDISHLLADDEDDSPDDGKGRHHLEDGEPEVEEREELLVQDVQGKNAEAEDVVSSAAGASSVERKKKLRNNFS